MAAAMEDVVLVYVESLGGELLGTVRDVPITSTGKQLKSSLGFSEDSVLCPMLLIEGSCLEESQMLVQLQVEQEATLTLVFSVDWGAWRLHQLVRELRSLGAFAAEAAVAALSPGMPAAAREWGVAHLQHLGIPASPAQHEKRSSALARMLAADPAHWLRASAAEAIRAAGLAFRCLETLAAAASDDPNRAVRRSCVVALGELGEAALPVSATVAFALVADHVRDVRAVAATALAQMGLGVMPDDAMALVEALGAESDKEVRQECSEALEHLLRTALKANDRGRILSFVRNVKQCTGAFAALPEADGASSVEVIAAALASASSTASAPAGIAEEALSLLVS
eukprot:gb/GFBE01053299.1/.p1 GENE.gb/GFBE01053299.1/~~gb/GFBE01053299.1/.p1  ORF type:complete len:341 (+),score=76.24 gb/GFBE01053299.1/:1-1023(+)